MSRSLPVRPRLLELEPRCTPAHAFINGAGDLVVIDDQPTDLLITQTGANTFEVTNHGVHVGAGVFNGVTGHLRVVTYGSHDDKVEVDLGGNTAPRSLIFYLGQGDNELTVHDGTARSMTYNGAFWRPGIFVGSEGGFHDDKVTVSGMTLTGNLAIYTAHGTDEVVVEDTSVAGLLRLASGIGSANFTVGATGNGSVGGATSSAGHILVTDWAGDGDHLLIDDNVETNRLTVLGFEDVTVAAGSIVNGNVSIFGAPFAPNTVRLEGEIDGDVVVIGGTRLDTVTVDAGATIGGKFTSILGASNDVIDLGGLISGNVFLATGWGDDVVDLAGTIEGNALIYLWDGNNQITSNALVGTPNNPRTLTIVGRYGDDEVNIAAGTEVNGELRVFTFGRNDTVTLDAAATFTTAIIDGGANPLGGPGDTFVGDKNTAGLTLRRFETFT